MSFLETEKLSTGDLISGSFRELADNRRVVLIYLGAFLLVGLAESVSPAAIGALSGLLALGGYFLGQYLLYRSMLRRAGFAGADNRIRVFRFAAMAFVIAIAMTFASYLFLIPAIIVAARWIAAPCYIVASERGLFASLGESWSATSGNTLPLSLAFSALFLVFFVLLVAVGSVGSVLEDLLGTNVTFTLGLHFLPLLLMGLSVTTYRRLEQEDRSLAEVFA